MFCYCSAVDAGITLVNEVGVDPGIDHLLAMECFDSVKDHGGKVGIILYPTRVISTADGFT